MDYLDINLNLSKKDLALKRAAHDFAKEVMRPVAKQLDAMTPEEAIADNSPLWDFMKQAYELEYHTVLLPDYVGGMGLSPLQQVIVLEELGWGSFGLAVQLAVVSFGALGAVYSNDDELIDKFAIPFCECTDGSIRGCWGGTEPDHGSDIINMGEDFFYTPDVRTNCRAKRDGDEWVINGQKSAWASGGTVSTVCWLHLQTDVSMGLAGWGCAIVPMDLPGVTKGKPLDKIGQRDLNQGELYFDEVRIPAKYMVIDPDFYEPIMEMFLINANIWMSSWATGLARAAFEEAFIYSQERKVGLRLLKEHYTTKQRIFEMFRRVEVSRAVARAAANLNFNISPGCIEYSIMAKNTATQYALDNASDAIQLLGGNGLTKEYLPEKLFRDARTALIEDGNNEVLARHGGHTLFETYPRSQDDF